MTKLAVYTSNKGKFNDFKRWLHQVDNLDLIWLQTKQSLIEGQSALDNARNKAVIGSLTSDIPIIATDEELYLDFLSSSDQPGAFIKRIVGNNHSEETIIEFYQINIFKSVQEAYSGNIITHFFLANKGLIIAYANIKHKCIFKSMPSEKWLDGKPLSAFHYIPQFGKYFSELSEKELKEYEKPFVEKMNHFIYDNLQMMT